MEGQSDSDARAKGRRCRNPSQAPPPYRPLPSMSPAVLRCRQLANRAPAAVGRVHLDDSFSSMGGKYEQLRRWTAACASLSRVMLRPSTVRFDISSLATTSLRGGAGATSSMVDTIGTSGMTLQTIEFS